MLERLLETLFFCGGAALELETRHARPTTGKADRWTAVAITAPALPVANAIGRAVRGWLQASYGKGVLLVAAETEAGASPKAGASASSSGITSNSGSATLSALLAVAEAISARCGRTVLAADILLEERILIVHCGATDLGGSGREGTEAAREVLRSVGRVLQMATRLFHCGEAGVAIATTASELFPSNLYSELCPEESEGALGEWLRLDARSAGTVIAVPCRRSQAARRCVCIGRRGGGLAAFTEGEALSGRGGGEEEEKLVAVFDGWCWLGPRLLQVLVPLLSMPPIDAATDAGRDTGESSRMSLSINPPNEPIDPPYEPVSPLNEPINSSNEPASPPNEHLSPPNEPPQSPPFRCATTHPQPRCGRLRLPPRRRFRLRISRAPDPPPRRPSRPPDFVEISPPPRQASPHFPVFPIYHTPLPP